MPPASWFPGSLGTITPIRLGSPPTSSTPKNDSTRAARTERAAGSRPTSPSTGRISASGTGQGQADQARHSGHTSSPYLLRPRYYEIEMVSPVPAPMAVAEWVFQLIGKHADPSRAIAEYWDPRPDWVIWEYMDWGMTIIRETAPVPDPTHVAISLHGEDRKRAEAEWPVDRL